MRTETYLADDGTIRTRTIYEKGDQIPAPPEQDVRESFTSGRITSLQEPPVRLWDTMCLFEKVFMIMLMVISAFGAFMFININNIYELFGNSGVLVAILWILPVVTCVLHRIYLSEYSPNRPVDAWFYAGIVTIGQMLMIWTGSGENGPQALGWAFLTAVAIVFVFVQFDDFEHGRLLAGVIVSLACVCIFDGIIASNVCRDQIEEVGFFVRLLGLLPAYVMDTQAIIISVKDFKLRY